jgi:hypothetical protein
MEMTMSVKRGYRTIYPATATAVGATYWATEFERIYVMTAARIRGDTAFARRRADAIQSVFVRGR